MARRFRWLGSIVFGFTGHSEIGLAQQEDQLRDQAPPCWRRELLPDLTKGTDRESRWGHRRTPLAVHQVTAASAYRVLPTEAALGGAASAGERRVVSALTSALAGGSETRAGPER